MSFQAKMGRRISPEEWAAHRLRLRKMMKDRNLVVDTRITDADIQACLDALKKLPPTNDHICPHCKNERVSKSEKSCWKCGGNLHP